MIDITFILLIFFMVTTKLTHDQRAVPVELPIAKAAVIPKDVSGRDIINIDEKGQFYIGEKPATLKEVKVYLKQRLKDFPPLRIYVRADGRVPEKQPKLLMNACAEAGAIEVIWATHQRK